LPGSSRRSDDLFVCARVAQSNRSSYRTGDFQVRRGASWVPVDTKLTMRPDGGLAPDVTVNAMTSSGGGSGPLVMLAKNGRSSS
jgi:hypothetical protein